MYQERKKVEKNGWKSIPTLTSSKSLQGEDFLGRGDGSLAVVSPGGPQSTVVIGEMRLEMSGWGLFNNPMLLNMGLMLNNPFHVCVSEV